MGLTNADAAKVASALANPEVVENDESVHYRIVTTLPLRNAVHCIVIARVLGMSSQVCKHTRKICLEGKNNIDDAGYSVITRALRYRDSVHSP
jgi:hypothetical protein